MTHQASAADLAALVDAGGVIAWASDGAGRFACASPAFCRRFGVDAEGLPGSGVADFARALDAGTPDGGILEVLLGAHLAGVSMPALQVGAAWWEVFTFTYAGTDAGALRGSIARDITTQRMAFAQETAQAQARHLADLGHALRNPLNGVAGVAALALDAGPPEPWRRYFGVAQSSAEAMLELVDNAVTRAREAAGVAVTSPATSPAAPGAAVRGLLVDGSAVNRTLVEFLLRQDGCVVTSVADGEAALQAAAAGEFDLVLVSPRLAGMNGLDMVRMLRIDEEEAGRARVPVIAMTSGDAPEDLARCRDAGADAVVTKPVEVTHLRAAIRRVLPARG